MREAQKNKERALKSSLNANGTEVKLKDMVKKADKALRELNVRRQ